MIKCSLNEFYCSAPSKCVSSQNLCIINICASNMIISRKLHQESSFSQNSENGENGCPKNKISCYDGTYTDTY